MFVTMTDRLLQFLQTLLKDIAKEVDEAINGKELEFTRPDGSIQIHTVQCWLGGDMRFLKLMLGQQVCQQNTLLPTEKRRCDCGSEPICGHLTRVAVSIV